MFIRMNEFQQIEQEKNNYKKIDMKLWYTC